MKRATTMSAKVEQYLEFRRGLGYRLKIEGQLLQQFGRFADASGHRGPLTIELALRWAQSAKVVIGCTGHGDWKSSAVSPGTWPLPNQARKCRDASYWGQPIGEQLLISTRPASWPPCWLQLGDFLRHTDLRPHTYATLIGLLACTGLRISEALRLAPADVDLGQRCTENSGDKVSQDTARATPSDSRRRVAGLRR